MMMEFNRVSSHLVALATGGMELGALSAMIFGFRERDYFQIEEADAAVPEVNLRTT